MLKIKDDIDIENLKKIGFEIQYNTTDGKPELIFMKMKWGHRMGWYSKSIIYFKKEYHIGYKNKIWIGHIKNKSKGDASDVLYSVYRLFENELVEYV